jgi:hypothetical protein
MSMSSCHSNKIHTQLEVIKMEILVFSRPSSYKATPIIDHASYHAILQMHSG